MPRSPRFRTGPLRSRLPTLNPHQTGRADVGPLVAGVLLGAASARATIAFFAVFSLALALWGTLSPAIRRAPSLDELDALPTSAEI